MTPAATEQQLLLPAPSLPLKEVSPPKTLLGSPVCPQFVPSLSYQLRGERSRRQNPAPSPAAGLFPQPQKPHLPTFGGLWGSAARNRSSHKERGRSCTAKVLHEPGSREFGMQGKDWIHFSTFSRPGLISSMERCKYFANKTLCPRCSPERRLSSEGDKDAERSIRGRDTPVFPWRRRQRSPLP